MAHNGLSQGGSVRAAPNLRGNQERGDTSTNVSILLLHALLGTTYYPFDIFMINVEFVADW